MDRQSFIEIILERYENPQFKFAMADADVSLEGGNPGCGDIIRIFIKIEGDRLKQISYEGEGCTISQASTDLLAEAVQGKTLQEIDELTHEVIVGLLGQEIVQNRTRCALLSLDTLKLALRRFREQAILAENAT